MLPTSANTYSEKKCRSGVYNTEMELTFKQTAEFVYTKRLLRPPITENTDGGRELLMCLTKSSLQDSTCAPSAQKPSMAGREDVCRGICWSWNALNWLLVRLRGIQELKDSVQLVSSGACPVQHESFYSWFSVPTG